MPSQSRPLVWTLRAIGVLDLCALVAVFSPRSWIIGSHHWLGLGDFPNEPIAGYLARCTSTWYGTYGLLLWFVSRDVEKYSSLIRCMAWAMFAQGILIVGIDLVEGMPIWWTLTEGPICSGLASSLLLLQRKSYDRSAMESLDGGSEFATKSI